MDVIFNARGSFFDKPIGYLVGPSGAGVWRWPRAEKPAMIFKRIRVGQCRPASAAAPPSQDNCELTPLATHIVSHFKSTNGLMSSQAFENVGPSPSLRCRDI